MIICIKGYILQFNGFKSCIIIFGKSCIIIFNNYYPFYSLMDLNHVLLLIGIAVLVVWYLASGAQGPRIDTWSGHSRLGLD